MTVYHLQSDLDPTIFRAYDIRGKVGPELSVDGIYTIARAIASHAIAVGESHIAVARDGRLSGPELLQALTAGLLDGGLSVINLGAVPTPLLYFSTFKTIARSGVMLTGSHNPPDYNGLKIVLQGETLADHAIQALYQTIVAGNFSQGQGTLHSYDIVPDYLTTIRQDIKLKKRLKVVVDGGNGIAGAIAPALYRALGCEVIELFCEVDGRFPNHHPDPAQLANMQDLIRVVQQEKADVGLAFDGDGDRLGVITDQGELIWPDRQMMLFAKDVLNRNPQATVIFDVKCSNHLAKIIAQCGGQPLLWKTGHSLIKAKMRESGALLAGEMSGHIFFKERWFGFDDGLYVGARLLEILAQEDRTCSQLFNTMPDSVNTPELKIPVSEQQKFKLIAEFIAKQQFTAAKLTTIDGLRVDFADGWGLLRASNTTPCLVMRFEADNIAALQRIQAEFKYQLQQLAADLTLPQGF